MRRSPAIELRDFDGTYIVAEAIDSSHCRVVQSNIAAPGEILYNPTPLLWPEAEMDVGGGTRVGPWELTRGPEEWHLDDPESSRFDESIQSQGTDDEEFVKETHRSVELRARGIKVRTLRRAGTPEWGDQETDPVNLALRLLAHYLAEHESLKGSRTRVQACRCDRFSTGGTTRLESLHAKVRETIATGMNPGETRVEKAVLKAYLKLKRKEKKLNAVAA